MQSLASDLRYAARELRKRPGFTLTAVVAGSEADKEGFVIAKGATPLHNVESLDRLKLFVGNVFISPATRVASHGKLFSLCDGYFLCDGTYSCFVFKEAIARRETPV